LTAEIGEYIVGAYLKLVEGCDFVDYNVRFPGGGLRGLNELDVIGLDFHRSTAYLCEVVTHIRGTLYKDNATTVERIRRKHQTQREYASEHLKAFESHHFQLWSPVVRVGYITQGLETIEGLELVINSDYTERVEKLKELGRQLTHDTGNPAFRMLQIIGSLRCPIR
jgi:hypothetical protein